MSGAIKDVVLGHGLVIPWDHYLSPRHMELAIRAVLQALPDNTLICSGRPVLVRLKALKPEECQTGALYALHVRDNGEITVELLVSGEKLMDGAHGAQV